MSKHRNYTKYSEPENNPEVAEDTVETVEETVEVAPKEESIFDGVIDNCSRLNIRVEPSLEAEVLTIVTKGTPARIKTISNPEWYAVQVNKYEGYCLKKYVSLV